MISGYISVRTTVLAKDTVVARMSRLVEEASSRKSLAQRFIDNFAKYYIPGMYHVHQISSVGSGENYSSLFVAFTANFYPWINK